MSEAHFSTSYPSARQAARVPPPDGYPGREGGAQGAPPEGSAAPGSLTWKTGPRKTTFAQLRQAMTARSGPLTVSWLPAPSAGRPVLAFAISRHVGNAVTRNRLRRRLRESARHRPGLPGGTYLIRARPGATGLGYAGLSAHLDQAITAVTRMTVAPAEPVAPGPPAPPQPPHPVQ